MLHRNECGSLFAPLALAVGLSLADLPAGSAAAASEPTTLANALIPADVIGKIAELPPDTGRSACRARKLALVQIEKIQPVTRIAGFTSRMSNADEVVGAAETERFVGEFGAQAIKALVTRDEELKRRLVRLLAKWADAGALLKSESCVTRNGNISAKESCREWRRRDGSDLSAMKDATFSTFQAFGLARAYHLALADISPDNLAAEHQSIRDWIAKLAPRLKRPGDVYFGLNMGWYWPAIAFDLWAGRSDRAVGKLSALQKGMVGLVKDDGSIVDRTTRGDRALWYHYTSLGEIVMSMEMMRAAGLTPSPRLEKKLHAAVDLFIAAIADEKVLHKWAKQRHNSTYVDEKQDWNWNGWPNNDVAGSWLHVYPYRYPDRPAAVELRRLVSPTAGSATKDTDLGIGIGCVYNAAAGLVPAEPQTVPLTFEHAMIAPKWILADSEGYYLTLRTVTVAGKPLPAIGFTVDTNYRAESRAPQDISLMQIGVPKHVLQDERSNSSDFGSCGHIASYENEIRFNFGEEEQSNACLFAKMGPNDRERWSAVHAAFPAMLDHMAARNNATALKLREALSLMIE